MTLEQLQNYFILSEFKNNLNAFKKENSLEKVLLSTPEDVDNALETLQPEALQMYMKSYGTTEQVKEKLAYDMDMKLLQQSQEFKKLDPQKKAEFNKMMVEYYVYNESIGLDNELKQIW